MKELLRFLADHLSFLFDQDSFKIEDSLSGSGGRAMVALVSPHLRIRVTRDRGEMLLAFQPIRGNDGEWFSLGLLRGVLTGERGGSEVLDSEWALFLEGSLDVVNARLSDPMQADELVDQLRRQAGLRAEERFE